jgi:hypothetical protein
VSCFEPLKPGYVCLVTGLRSVFFYFSSVCVYVYRVVFFLEGLLPNLCMHFLYLYACSILLHCYP